MLLNRYGNFRGRRVGVMTQHRPIPGFNPNDPQYLCFCKTLHVLRGAYSIGYFHAVCAVATFIFACLMAGNPEVMGVAWSIIVAITSIIVAFFSGLLLVGLRAQIYKFLIPYLIQTLFLILGAGISLILATLELVEVGENPNRTKNDIGQAVLITFITLMVLLCEVWFFLTVLAALRFVRDQDIATQYARLFARQLLYAGMDYSPESEMQRISAEYRLPPPPPSYCNERQASPGLSQNGATFAPPFADGPPGYEEACSSEQIVRSSSNLRIDPEQISASEIVLGVENFDYSQSHAEDKDTHLNSVPDPDNDESQCSYDTENETAEKSETNSAISDLPLLYA